MPAKPKMNLNLAVGGTAGGELVVFGVLMLVCCPAAVAAGQGTNSPMTAIGVVVVVTAVTVVTVAGPTFIIP